MPHFKHIALLVFVVLGFGLAGGSLAHDGAKGIVKERMDMMKDIGANMKVLGSMAKGAIAFDPAKASSAGYGIAEQAARIPKTFPEGTSGHPSEASKAIWTEWPRFESLARDLSVKAETFAAMAEKANSMDSLKPEFGGIAASCKTCHEAFRVKKK